VKSADLEDYNFIEISVIIKMNTLATC